MSKPCRREGRRNRSGPLRLVGWLGVGVAQTQHWVQMPGFSGRSLLSIACFAGCTLGWKPASEDFRDKAEGVRRGPFYLGPQQPSARGWRHCHALSRRPLAQHRWALEAAQLLDRMGRTILEAARKISAIAGKRQVLGGLVRDDFDLVLQGRCLLDLFRPGSRQARHHVRAFRHRLVDRA